MLRLKAHGLNTSIRLYSNRIRYGLHRYDIFRLNISLNLVLFGSGYIHNLYCIGIFAVFLNRRAAECYFHNAAPDLVIQLIAFCIQQVNIIGKGCNYLFLLACCLSFGLYVFLYNIFNAGYYAGNCFHTSRKHTLRCMDMNNSSVFHCQLSAVRWMLASLHHHHTDALFLSHAVHCVPCGLRTILIVCDRVSSQFLTVCHYRFHCVADLILYTKVQIFSVLYSAGAVNDSCGSFGSDGIFHLPAFHIIKSMQLIQSRSIDLTCAAPANTNQVTVVRLRCTLDLILSGYRILCRSCGLFHRSRLLYRLGLFGSGCRIAFLRQVALVHQSFIALLGSRGFRLVSSLLAARYLRRGCHIIIARCCH